MSTTNPDIHKPGTDDGWHAMIAPGSQFPPEADRYHLYIGFFCPFAHRANVVRLQKHLDQFIDMSIVAPYPKGDSKGWPGWRFPASDDEYPGATVDKLFGSKYLHEVYFKADPEYKGRFTVPMLWDKKTGTIVNNESAELLRWLPAAFNTLLPPPIAAIELYPAPLRSQIDAIAPWLQRDFNVGVYAAGFAPDQATYDKNVIPVFGALNKLERLTHKHGGPYILGKELTEIDVRAFATIIRFDTVYVQHFKCNLGTIRHDYPVLNAWLRHVYWNVEGFKESTDFKHIKENYTKSHFDINPRAITPMGPWPDVEHGPAETDYSKLTPGGIMAPEVLEYEANLDSAEQGARGQSFSLDRL